ncbi:histidinol-phosphate aminotransferase [Gilbertella persicaria]|uniref:histidinol-phosphate transaminase n=1 Tax=Rhizopus stolonifer TaxID=4846 RepID=A0A367KW27_RHIST|nr:histidinol-phosphate aminotransferase [Gilbertella persicaria]KAI8098398.1 histidinol-phosphate aminotransferase [Gilbertella persicaria]RCI06364.1 histidinol-phosphate transaminase [Rhizopus stolonifer]
MPFDLTQVIRPNILALKPYRCARDDFSEGVLLDANENAYGPALSTEQAGDLNRYPDPYQSQVKERILKLRNLKSTKNLFLGVGSDEVIDLLIRIACVPAKDKILITPPTYGMYSVCAQINDVEVVKSALNVENGVYQLDLDNVFSAIKSNPEIKIVFLCSPGNPTGTCLSHASIRTVLESDYSGIVVVDEAYVDFVDKEEGSVATWVDKYPNLVVMQTLSKSFGLAGIRVGIAVGHSDIIQILNNTKAPYNIGTPSALLAAEALSDEGLQKMFEYRKRLINQRGFLIEKLNAFKDTGRILGGNDANFVLVEILDKTTRKPSNERAHKVYLMMAESLGVVVRFRGTEYGCESCLRITVGTEEENEKMLAMLQKALDAN